MKKWIAAAVAAPFLLILALMLAFGMMLSGSATAQNCGEPVPISAPSRPQESERPAGGGVFVGGKWHYGEDGKGRERWSPERIARKAEQYGLPGKTMAQIAHGESQYYPFIVQHDPGDGNVGFGFFQFTPNAWGGPDSLYNKKLRQLGGQRGLEDINKQFEMARFMYIATGHNIESWHGTDYVTDWSTPRVTTKMPGGQLVAEECPDPAIGLAGAIEGSPKNIIDTVVLPLAKKCGIIRTVAENDAANARHGPTNSGGVSDHQGPPDQAWAADTSNGSAPTPEMDCHAKALIEKFQLPTLDFNTSGAAGSEQTTSVIRGGYRFQLIYRSSTGGNHDNHTHFGSRRVAGPAF